MSKSVLLRIEPKYCKMIFDGTRRYERRRDKPDIPTPFKCYIYCPHDDTGLWKYGEHLRVGPSDDTLDELCLNNSVIGEFVCYSITVNKGFYHWNIHDIKLYNEPKCLSDFRVGTAPRPPYSWVYV